jgi:NADPH:quinone reductase-like Zn-dependent oxidoreductase
MRAFRIHRHGGPEVLNWEEVPTPQPAADEVRVRVRACALNRLDLWVRNGVPGHRFPLPLTPGSEVAGEIDARGELVTNWQPGAAVLVAPGVSCGLCDRCLGAEDMLCRGYQLLGENRDGGYAEFVVVPARNLLPLPSGLSFAEAAALPLVFLTAWHMLHARARLRPFEDVLVHAAGSGVSSAAIQIARLAGAARIIATAGGAAKLAKARQLGATHTIDYGEADFVAAVRDITGRKGVDVVVDHVGGETFERSLEVLAWGGRLVLCGATTAPTATLNLRALFFKNQSVLGSTMGSLAELRRLLQFVERGDLRPVVDRVLPLERAAEAQAALENREQFGKIVLAVDAGPQGEHAER